jgi:type VI secretion system protein ImpA
MAATPLLDFAALLAPIPGEDPEGGSAPLDLAGVGAGVPVPFEVRQKLEEDRKEDDPEAFAPDDPMRPKDLKKADWRAIVRLAQETLTGVSKDLLVAARLTEALVRLHGFNGQWDHTPGAPAGPLCPVCRVPLHGFAGLRDGLRLLRGLVDECWTRLRPPVEDGDVEPRAAPFAWLDDPVKGARFPTTLRLVPLVWDKDGAYGWQDWRLSQDPKGAAGREQFERAVRAMPAEYCAAVALEIAQSQDELRRLTQSLADKMGPAAPGLGGIHLALEECHGLVSHILRDKRPVSGAERDTSPEVAAPATAPPAAPARAPGSRAEAYRQLAQAAAVLRELEPHSPIPYLVQRAVELGSLPFPQLIKVLIRDANVLNELNRELGLKEPPETAEG